MIAGLCFFLFLLGYLAFIWDRACQRTAAEIEQDFVRDLIRIEKSEALERNDVY